MIPVYKIEVWEPAGGSPLYTIEHDAISIYTKEIVTKGIGFFNISLVAKKGLDYCYYDIDPHDKVKIWFGYDAVSGDPDFIGRIQRIEGTLTANEGYIRHLSGLSQGEILLRRFKKDTYYNAIDASVIATELANDLSLGTGDITADTIDIHLESADKTYCDVLQKISDYWYDAGNKVQKDFYVDVDFDLVWKTRPLRTAGVETLTVGDNILSYRVVQDVLPIKNSITVYGATYTTPSNKDSYTESTTNWTSDGALTADNTNQKAGIYSVKTTANNIEPYMEKTFPSIKCGWKNHRHLNFRYYLVDQGGLGYGVSFWVYILAPNNANRFRHGFNTPGLASWLQYRNELGPHNEGTGHDWQVDAGTPDWNDVQGVRFYFVDSCVGACAADTINIDELYFSDQHYTGTATDAASIASYGQRDYAITDPGLLSDSDCTKRAESILFQQKDLVKQIEVSTIGNTNILIGDRLNMTIPAENISGVDFDVISVVNSFSDRGYITTPTMLNSAIIREPLITKQSNIIANIETTLRRLSRDEKTIW